MRVLIIEDNPDIVTNLFNYLEPAGYSLDVARNGQAGLTMATHGTYDVIVLDLRLPGLDGIELCRRLRREERKSTPVLMLTALDTLRDKLAGFESGADDYLVKPFLMAELDARLRVLARRAGASMADPILRVGPLRLDTETMIAMRGDRRMELTPTSFRLLSVLMRASPGIVSRAALEYALWGDEPPDSSALRTHIYALRNALDKPFETPMLRTRHSVGYRVVDPAQDEADDDGAA